MRHNGEIKFKGKSVYISTALVGEPVGLLEDADGNWDLIYGPIALGTLAHDQDRLRKPKRKACGLVDNADALTTGSTVQQQQN